jgi:hypothetical protein
MADPLTTSMIFSLAIQEFVKSGVGELTKKVTAEAISEMAQLRKMIWNKVMEGKHPGAEIVLKKAMDGESESIKIAEKWLEVEMSDQNFADRVQTIAQKIQEIEKQINSNITTSHSISITQTNQNSQNCHQIDAKNSGTINIAGIMHLNDQKKGLD